MTFCQSMVEIGLYIYRRRKYDLHVHVTTPKYVCPGKWANINREAWPATFSLFKIMRHIPNSFQILLLVDMGSSYANLHTKLLTVSFYGIAIVYVYSIYQPTLMGCSFTRDLMPFEGFKMFVIKISLVTN